MEGRPLRLIGIALLTVTTPAIGFCQETASSNDGGFTRTERRPVVDTTWHEQNRTVYDEQYVTEMRESQRVVYTPVVEYEWEQYRINWWNLFGNPEYGFQLKPSVRWESRVEPAQVPVTRREVVPRTEVVRVPVYRLGFEHYAVPMPQVATRPATTSTAAGSAGTLSRTPPAANHVGGVLRIENDPPRVGRAVSGELRR